MNTGHIANKTTRLCRDTGGKGTLPAQHTTFNTLDNWAITPPPNQKGKRPERKGYRVMARNMYTIHSVTGTCRIVAGGCVVIRQASLCVSIFVLRQKYSLQIFGVIRFIKLQNNT